MVTGTLLGAVIGGVLGFILLIMCLYSFHTVREKEVIILERFGKFHSILTAGAHWQIPFVDQPRHYPVRYVTDSGGTTRVIVKNEYRISLQNEVLDFPRQNVITKDGASIYLDCIMSYQLASPSAARTMVYSIDNQPHALSCLLRAHLHSLTATLDVDQIIEDTSALNTLSQLLNETTMHWGPVRVNFVKIQRIETGDLATDLAKKKNADLTNKDTIINAKSKKQTLLVNAESNKENLIKQIQGETRKLLSINTGKSQAIVNFAKAQAEELQKLIPIMLRRGEDPVQYLLSMKYIAGMKSALTNVHVDVVPPELVQMWSDTLVGVKRIKNIE